MSSQETPSWIQLREHFLRKQAVSPKYSVRAFARDLGVSPSFANGLLTGKKPIPEKRLGDIAVRLGIDSLSIGVLKKTLTFEKLSENSKALLSETRRAEHTTLEFVSQFKNMNAEAGSLELWRHWYNVAILDLATCADFEPKPTTIAKRLSITREEATTALHFLVSQNYLVQVHGRWTKNDKLLRLPLKKSHQTIRAFHQQLMHKSVQEMNQKTQPSDYEARLISGMTIATSHSRVTEAKRRLDLALHEIAQFLTAGEEPAEEVYQLGVQFFPLTKKP